MKKSRGQALPYFLVMMLILVMCWAMLMNIAKLTKDRIMMQNAADNAAISAAVYKARVYNTLGFMNYVLATLLYGDTCSGSPFGFLWTGYSKVVKVAAGGYPIPVPIPFSPMSAIDDQQRVMPVWDAVLPGDIQYYLLIGSVRLIQDARKVIMDAYPAEMLATIEFIGRRQEKNAQGNDTGADLVKFVNWQQVKELGLIKNENGMVFYRVRVGDFWLQLQKYAYNAVLSFFDGGSATIDEIYVAKEDEVVYGGSWLYMQTNRFDTAQHIVVEAYKFPYVGSNRGYPFFRDFLGITWPTMHTIAAAGLYNTKGAMFPRDQKGMRNSMLAVINCYKQGSDDGGWDAHLIPVNQNGILH